MGQFLTCGISEGGKWETEQSRSKSTIGVWRPLLGDQSTWECLYRVFLRVCTVPGCRASWALISGLGRTMLIKHPGLLFTLSTVSVRLWSWFWTEIQWNYQKPPRAHEFWGFPSFRRFLRTWLKHWKWNSTTYDGCTWRSRIRVPCRCSRVVASA